MSDISALAHTIAIKAMHLYIASDRSEKTVAYFERVLWRSVRELYNGVIDEFGFIDDMTALIEQQFNRAWREGARSVGVDPVLDFTDEDYEIIQMRIDSEYEYIPDFTQAIVDARNAGERIDQFRNRVSMWANRYNEIVNDARAWYGERQRLEWKLGKTEEHCATCAALSGIVAFGEEWVQSGFHPQGAPNDLLECGGWQCDCALEPTTRKRTPRALDRLMDLAVSRGV